MDSAQLNITLRFIVWWQATAKPSGKWHSVRASHLRGFQLTQRQLDLLIFLLTRCDDGYQFRIRARVLAAAFSVAHQKADAWAMGLKARGWLKRPRLPGSAERLYDLSPLVAEANASLQALLKWETELLAMANSSKPPSRKSAPPKKALGAALQQRLKDAKYD